MPTAPARRALPPVRRRAVLRGLAAAGLAGASPLAWPAAAAAADPAPAASLDPIPAGRSLDPGLIRRAVERAAGLDQLHSLIVARGGEIAVAEAFRGPPVDRPVNVKSVSKTVVATLTGIAIGRGVIPGGIEAAVARPVADLLGDLVPADADPRVRDITLGDLLTMQAGLERTSGANYGPWVASRDWVRHALTRPFVADPGTRMQYSTGSFHLLGVALARAAGDSLLTLARDWLGEPLDIAVPAWTRDPQGYYLGGNNMALSPMALYRFGEMWRQGGSWQGTQVVGRDWIGAAWTARTRSPWSGDLYGYGWFLSESAGRPVAYARGYGGQMLFVMPSLGLTVAVTSDPNRPARSDGHVGAIRDLLAETIVPAAA